MPHAAFTENRSTYVVDGAPEGNPPRRPPLMRPTTGRVFCGVCRGISLHLGIPVAMVRLAFVVSTLLFSVGAAAYIFLWVFVPVGDPMEAWSQTFRRPNGSFEKPLAHGNLPYSSYGDGDRPQTHTGIPNDSPPPAHAPEEASDEEGIQPESFPDLAEAIKRAPKSSLFALAGFAVIIVSAMIMMSPLPIGAILPIILFAMGIALPWLHFGEEEGQLRSMAVGLVLTIAAYALFIFNNMDWLHRSPAYVFGSGIALLAGAGVAMAPWFNRLIEDLGVQRALKEREEERADMTAHLHDGVLQTLALIQLHSSEPQTVFSLARGQERDLREWLYQERTPPERSVSSGIKEIAAHIEDEYGKAVDMVSVGDAMPSAQTDALLDATGQALLNAVQHGGEPISVYCEAGDGNVDVYVRDHGDGFDMQSVPPDRLGIRESIQGRIRRRGGNVEIVSRPHWGTEVRMHMPIATDPVPEESADRFEPPEQK